MKKSSFLFAGFFIISCLTVICQISKDLTSDELAVYQQHESDILTNATLNYSECLAELKMNYSLDSDCINRINGQLLERESRICICNYLYPTDAMLRYKAKQDIRILYGEILTRNLLHAGANASTYYYNMVLNKKNILKISETQFDSIVERAIDVNNQLKKKPQMDTWEHELSTFQRILSDIQLNVFLRIKNNNKVKYQVAASWAKLKENGLDYDLDSASVYKDLFNYHMANFIAADLNYNNETLKREAWNGINEKAPLAIRRIKSVTEAQKVKKIYSGSFSW
jgi:hypothetical protein